MASRLANRSLQPLSRRVRPCQCTSSASRSASIRQLLATSSKLSKLDTQYENDQAPRPRWAYTPERMKAPHPTKIKDPDKAWECNGDPAKLDQFYIRFLGPSGDTLLTEDVKWLAVTHKSFDQGRRGFNDRLAFFGRRILNLQTTLALLHSPVATQTQSLPDPRDASRPFTHPALEGLANLTDVEINNVLTKDRLARLAKQMGMPEILRWKPKNPEHLLYSGIEAVLTTTIYAVVGAVALQKGGDVAAQVARERVLKALGIS